MTKFMTRKGLALGAVFALTASALVSTPANAAGEISLAVNGGTGTSTILGEAFSLKATVGSLVPDSSNDEVTFLVDNSTGATLTYTADAGTREVGVNNDSIETTVVDGAGVAATAASSGASDYVKGGFTQDGDRTTITTAEAYLDNQTLSISSAATAAHSVTVTAWLDADGSGTINNSEFASSPVTISFVTAANSGLVASYVTNPQVGDNTATATITSSVVNVAQVAVANIGVQFGKYSAGSIVTNVTGKTFALAVGTLANTAAAVTLNTTTKASLDTAATTTVAAFAASTSYTLRAVYSSNPNTAAWVVLGTADTRATGAVAADATESSVTITADSNVTAAGVVRKSYTGDVVYTVKALEADKDPVVGATVRITTTAATQSTGILKINGVTVSESATQTHDAITDAAGLAVFTVTNSTGSTSDVLSVTSVTVQGIVIVADATNLTFAAASYTLTDPVAVNATDVTRAVDAAGALTVTAKAIDQWSSVLTAADVRVKATLSGRTVAVLTDSLADGSASFTVTDGANTTGDTTVTFTLEELNSSVWGSLVDYTVGSLNNYTVKYSTQTDAVLITANNGTTSDLAASQTRVTTKAWNTNSNHLVAAVSTFDAGVTPGSTLDDETVTISGSVINASTLVAKAGAMVTVSGDSNILFVQGNVASFGSISFYDADGVYSVDAFSNKVLSASTVTVTAGAASKTATVSFSAGETNVGTAIAFTAPASANAGDALQIVATLTDKFGNAVDTDIVAANFNGDADTTDIGETSAGFSVTATGPGVTLVSLPTATDAAGQAYVSRLLGSNDISGNIVVTVTYGGADGVIGTGLDDITASITVRVGAPAAVASDTKVNVGSFKGFVALYAKGYEGKKMSAIVAGKWIVVASLASDFERVVRYTGAGYDIVTTIYIDGVKVQTFNVTTK
jgi:hypothetical protein